LGDRRDCILFTDKGIHFRSTAAASGPDPFFIKYRDFSDRTVQSRFFGGVNQGDGQNFDTSGCSMPKAELVELLGLLRMQLVRRLLLSDTE
jgi:hypothetical protein